MTRNPDFKGYIHNVGGPTANFRRRACDGQAAHGACRGKSCLKHRGVGKYLVADGVHKDNDALWEYNESFIQVGDVEGDFVEVTMQGAAGGTGFFFKEGYAQNPVLAMKNSILPVVAAPDPLKILLKWEKVSGEGDFVDPNQYDPDTLNVSSGIWRIVQ